MNKTVQTTIRRSKAQAPSMADLNWSLAAVLRNTAEAQTLRYAAAVLLERGAIDGFLPIMEEVIERISCLAGPICSLGLTVPAKTEKAIAAAQRQVEDGGYAAGLARLDKILMTLNSYAQAADKDLNNCFSYSRHIPKGSIAFTLDKIRGGYGPQIVAHLNQAEALAAGIHRAYSKTLTSLTVGPD